MLKNRHRYTKMIGIFVVLILATIIFRDGITANVVSSKTTTGSVHPVTKLLLDKNIEDTFLFFVDFTEKAKLPERSEFETDAEYRKRLPKPWDTLKLVYFRVDTGAILKNYKYDLNKKILTGVAGFPLTKNRNDDEDEFVYNGDPIIILSAVEDKGSYEAQNGYGTKVIVSKLWTSQYILNFTNIANLPDDIYDTPKGQFMLSINRPPKEAESLSNKLEIIVGVYLLEYKQSLFICSLSEKPTFNKPTDLAVFDYLINAHLVKIILRNKETKEILSEYDVPENKPTK